MIVLYILAGLAAIIALFLILKLAQLKGGRERAEKERGKMVYGKLPSIGTVKNLSILPLIDFYSTGDDLKTEPGVSYLIKADDTTILLDVGYNAKKEHPSPLILNMEKLGVKIEDIVHDVYQSPACGSSRRHERTKEKAVQPFPGSGVCTGVNPYMPRTTSRLRSGTRNPAWRLSVNRKL